VLTVFLHSHLITQANRTRELTPGPCHRGPDGIFADVASEGLAEQIPF
jgi:hypothetical protein